MAEKRPRGTVLRFDLTNRPTDPGQERRRRTRSVVGSGERTAVATRIDNARDAALNAEWDRLLELVVQASTWRDPESLAAVSAVLTRLTRETLREWR